MTAVPWNVSYLQYSPAGMTTPLQAGNNNDPPYAMAPRAFTSSISASPPMPRARHIRLTLSAPAVPPATTVAVVESTYELQQGVVNRGGL